MKEMTITERIEALIEHLNAGLYERREHVAVMLLAAISGQNAFLLGPPGTAKSLLARRLASVFHEGTIAGNYFEYLMNRFSTPEDIFGPISITKLKEDKYERLTAGFLPSARFAFLDEIWKSSPAILNTLLTIINEKKFRNGDTLEGVPLEFLVAASNEVPPPGQGLEALYDRFIVRLFAPPISENDHFREYISTAGSESPLPDGLAITPEEIKAWREKIEAIEVSDEAMDLIEKIRHQLAALPDTKSNKPADRVYVSDRRWLKAVQLMKASAFLCGRDEMNLADVFLLRHCLWTTEDNRQQLVDIVENTIRESGFVVSVNNQEVKDIDAIIALKKELEKEVDEQLYYSTDIYKTCPIGQDKNGPKYFEHTLQLNRHQDPIKVYIPEDKMDGNGNFHPVDEQGNKIDYLICDFGGGKTFKIASQRYRIQNSSKEWVDSITDTPEISIHKGDRREKPHPHLINGFSNQLKSILDELTKTEKWIEEKKLAFEGEINTLFVSNETKNIALEGVQNQLDKTRQNQEDCIRLSEKIDPGGNK